MSETVNHITLKHNSDFVMVNGNWIWDSHDCNASNPVTVLFRRILTPEESARITILRISADSRYRVYLNSNLVSRGPCRGTVEHYHYETIDLSGKLDYGKPNVLAVEVRWYGCNKGPLAEVHLAAGLWAMLGNHESPSIITTDSHWRAFRSPGHTLHYIIPHPYFFTVVDPVEDVDLQQVPYGWVKYDFDDSSWSYAVEVSRAMERYHTGRMDCPNHELFPREIPPLAEFQVSPQNILWSEKLTLSENPIEGRRIIASASDVIRDVPPFWGDNTKPLEFHGQGTHSVTMDMGQLVTAYPKLMLDAPAGTMVELRYSEALWRNDKKGRRDNQDGNVEGYYDIFTCRQGINAIEPFMWRTFRYIKISVHHPAGTAALTGFSTQQTNYPFERVASFESSDTFIANLMDVSWRTALLCAHEHYEDCPYYEQLQYIGDTRLQAMVSYIVSGDFRLARQALRQFARSVREDGIIRSRTPCANHESQIIPNFSLIWIEFLEDFWMHSGDNGIIKELWHTVESILGWFDHFDKSGILENVPYWIFTDWTLPSDEMHLAGSVGELNLRRLGAIKAAARLAAAIQRDDLCQKYLQAAEKVRSAILQKLWNPQKGLFADKFDGTVVGEHTSILAILFDVVDKQPAMEILEKLEKSDNIARTTIYYSYYTFRAYEKLGLWEKAYTTRKTLWENQLELGATTWFESPEPSRSDCHGWGSWIMCDMLASVLGIKPATPGYKSIIIKPNFMGLDWAKGKIPTINGMVEVAWKRMDDCYECTIVLPQNTTGIFIAPDGTRYDLLDLEQTITFAG